LHRGVHELFEKLRERFDYVFVDLPPLTPAVDVRATGHFVQQYVLVMEWGKTRVECRQEALIAPRAQGTAARRGPEQGRHHAASPVPDPFTAVAAVGKVASHWVVRDTAS